MTVVAATHTAAPLISHFCCWRRSPSARRQDSTWRATNTSQNTAITGRMTASTEPSHAELPAGKVDGPQVTTGNDAHIARGDGP